MHSNEQTANCFKTLESLRELSQILSHMGVSTFMLFGAMLKSLFNKPHPPKNLLAQSSRMFNGDNQNTQTTHPEPALKEASSLARGPSGPK